MGRNTVEYKRWYVRCGRLGELHQRQGRFAIVVKRARHAAAVACCRRSGIATRNSRVGVAKVVGVERDHIRSTCRGCGVSFAASGRLVAGVAPVAGAAQVPEAPEAQRLVEHDQD